MLSPCVTLRIKRRTQKLGSDILCYVSKSRWSECNYCFYIGKKNCENILKWTIPCCYFFKTLASDNPISATLGRLPGLYSRGKPKKECILVRNGPRQLLINGKLQTCDKNNGYNQTKFYGSYSRTGKSGSIRSFFPPARFWKTAGGIVLGSVAVSTVSADVSPYISVVIKASFLKFAMCNICKNNIAKMFLDFFKILNCSFEWGFFNFW